MKKQSAVSLFFSMFLRATVIILAIVIVVFGGVLATKIAKNKKEKGKDVVVSDNVLTEAEARDDLLYNTTEATGENPDTQVSEDGQTTGTEPITATDKRILVLNSTETLGLAGRWCQRLNDNGYANTAASDFAIAQTTTRVISRNDGIGKELVSFFAGASYEVGIGEEIQNGTLEDVSVYDIVIIVGSNDDDGQ